MSGLTSAGDFCHSPLVMAPKFTVGVIASAAPKSPVFNILLWIFFRRPSCLASPHSVTLVTPSAARSPDNHILRY